MQSNLSTYYNNPLVKYVLNDENNNNYLVYAGGGFGKTTAMQCLWFVLLDKASKGENIVPVYVDIKTLNLNDNSPIFKYMYNRYCGCDSDYNRFCDMFIENKTPGFAKNCVFWLLIDGYNEVAGSLSYKLQNDIKKLSMCSNTRIVFSSRVDENSVVFAGVQKLILNSLDDNQIETYLKRNFNIEDIETNRINPNLIEILRVPMFLETFVKIYKDRFDYPHLFDTSIIRKGDILEKHTEKILEDLKEQDVSTEIIKKEFAIKYYLPALAFCFAQKETLSISDAEYLKLGLEDESKWDTYFKLYLNSSERAGYKHAFVEGKDEWISIFKNQFALMEKIEDSHAFKHHIWRDFFAAKHIVNAIKSGALADLEISVDENIRHFVGELLKKDSKCECDYENKTELNSDSSPLEDFMQKYSQELSPLAVGNCVEIMKTSRKNKVTADYSNLDLTQAFFGDCDFPNSIFDNSNIKESCFIPDGHTGNINAVALSSDGKSLLSCGNDEFIRVWNAKTGVPKESFLLEDGWKITSIAFSQDGKWAVSGSVDGNIRIWDVENCRQDSFVLKGHVSEIVSVCFSRENKYVLGLSADGLIIIWNMEKREKTTVLNEGHGNKLSIVKFLPDSKQIVSGSWNGDIKLWNIETKSGREIFHNQHEKVEDYQSFGLHPINLLDVTLDGKFIVTSSLFGTDIEIWDVEKECCNCQLSNAHTIGVSAISFSNNGQYVVSGGLDKTIKVWDVKKGQLKYEIPMEFKETPTSIVFSHNDERIISGIGNLIYVFNAETGELCCGPLGKFENIGFSNSVDISPLNNLISKGCKYGSLELWDIKNEQLLKKITLEEKGSSITAICFSNDGNLLISGDYKGNISVWEVESGLLKERIFNTSLGKTKEPIMDIKFFHNSQKFVVGRGDGRVEIWDTQKTLLHKQRISSPLKNLHELSISKDDNYILCCADMGFIDIWDIRTNSIRNIAGGRDSRHAINSISFSPNQKSFVTGCSNGAIQIWDIEKLSAKVVSLQGHKNAVTSVAFSSNGDMLASVSSDNTIAFWKVEGASLKNIKTLITGCFNEFCSVSFLRDDNFILTNCKDGSACIWDVDTGRAVRYFDIALGNNIKNSNFKNSIFKSSNPCGFFIEKEHFYRTLYSNGADVPEKFLPKILDLGD